VEVRGLELDGMCRGHSAEYDESESTQTFRTIRVAVTADSGVRKTGEAAPIWQRRSQNALVPARVER